MQLEFQTIATTTHTVDVPERCPGCGASLHDGKLVCEQLEYTEQSATTRNGEIGGLLRVQRRRGVRRERVAVFWVRGREGVKR